MLAKERADLINRVPRLGQSISRVERILYKIYELDIYLRACQILIVASALQLAKTGWLG